MKESTECDSNADFCQQLIRVRNSSPAIAGLETEPGVKPRENYSRCNPSIAGPQSPAPHGVQGKAAVYYF